MTAEDGSAVKVSAFFKGETQNDASFGAIEQLRDEVVPAAFGGVPGVEVFVGGNTAIFLDFLHVTDSYQWIVLAFVLGSVVPAADGRVPFADPADQGDPDEPAVGRLPRTAP